jgi:hypothetical protein
LRTAFGFKGLAALANLGSRWLIRDISARLDAGDGLIAFALYALNPLVLFETAGIGHNEAVVVVFALGGVWLVLRGLPWAGLVALLVSADVKSVTASVAVFVAAWFIFQGQDARVRARRAVGVLGVATLTGIVLWAPFWAGAAMFTTSRAILNKSSELRMGGAGEGISAARVAIFCTMVALCAVLAARGSISRTLNLSAAVGLVFLLWIFPWKLAWYSIPPLALAIAARRSPLNGVLLAVILGYGIIYSQRYITLHPL